MGERTERPRLGIWAGIYPSEAPMGEDLNLDKNTTVYKYNYKYRDAVEITLNFINIKY